MGLVQIIIDDSTSKIITGTYEWDREDGGTLIVPSGTAFPGTPAAKELFWRTDENKLYRRNNANDAWVGVVAVPAAHATSHQPGGGDAMAVDAVAGTGSLRTLGTAATAACAGNDSRLSDARTPTAHATSHKSGGGDAIKLDELAAPTDITTLDATTSQHGLLPKLGGGTANFLRADGSWSAPPGGTDTNAIHKNTAAEISTITEKATPVSADLVVVEDSADSYNKKRVQVGNLPGGSGTDPNAIHKNVASEISAITAKTYPSRWDLLVIEDSDDSNAKKKVTVGAVIAAEPEWFAGPAYFFDEFFPPELNPQWTVSTSGTGSLVELQLAPGGQVLVRSGNANGRTAELYFGGGVAWQSLAYEPDIYWRMKYDGTNNAHIECEVHYADANNYVFLEADWGGNWLLSCRNGGTLTQVDTGVALDTAWHVYEIKATPSAVTVRIDGVLKATITTNIPTAAGTTSLYIASTGTGGTKNLLVDGFHYGSARAT